MAGDWRFDVVVSTQARVPILGDVRVQTQKVMLAHVDEQPDGSLVQQHTACAMYARSNRKLAETWFPPSFVSAMRDQRYTITAMPEAGGLHLHSQVSPVVIGWDPALAGGGMPRKLDDPGVIDADLDGEPGVTVHVRAPLFGQISIYMVQSSQTSIDGWAKDTDTIVGTAQLDHLDQRTLGASNRLFATNVPLAPDDHDSWFRMVRVPTGTTCATLDAASPPLAGSPAADAAPAHDDVGASEASAP